VICEVEDDPEALSVLERLRIPTGVPLVIHYSGMPTGKYRAWPVPFSDECIIQWNDNDDEQHQQLIHPPSPPENMGHAKLPVWPLNMCIPLLYHVGEHEERVSTPTTTTTTTTATPPVVQATEMAQPRRRQRHR
jgi:hypothetical protein